MWSSQPRQPIPGEINRQALSGGGDVDDFAVHVKAGGTAEFHLVIAPAKFQAAAFGEGLYVWKGEE